MLLHQVFSFNSPVWFNVGTASPQQVSACLPYDALVSTPAGLIPIGELVERDAVGTKVFDANGLTAIVATKANGVRDVIRLHTKAGHQLDLTPDHVVWKSTGSGTGRWVEAGTLQPGDALEWHRTHSYGESVIEVRSSPRRRWPGWLQGDGFVGQYDQGTNRSLTIEAMTVTDAEREWVVAAIDDGVPRRPPARARGRDPGHDARLPPHPALRRRAAPFVERWGLRARGVDMTVPAAPVHRTAARRRLLPAQPLPGRGLRVPPRALHARRHGHDQRAAGPRGAEPARPVRDLRPGRPQGGPAARTGTTCGASASRTPATAGSSPTRSASSTRSRRRSSRRRSSCPAVPARTSSAWRSRASRSWVPRRSTTSRPSPASSSPTACACTTASSSPSTTRWSRSSTGTARRG